MVYIHLLLAGCYLALFVEQLVEASK